MGHLDHQPETLDPRELLKHSSRTIATIVCSSISPTLVNACSRCTSSQMLPSWVRLSRTALFCRGDGRGPRRGGAGLAHTSAAGKRVGAVVRRTAIRGGDPELLRLVSGGGQAVPEIAGRPADRCALAEHQAALAPDLRGSDDRAERLGLD